MLQDLLRHVRRDKPGRMPAVGQGNGQKGQGRRGRGSARGGAGGTADLHEASRTAQTRCSPLHLLQRGHVIPRYGSSRAACSPRLQASRAAPDAAGRRICLGGGCTLPCLVQCPKLLPKEVHLGPRFRVNPSLRGFQLRTRGQGAACGHMQAAAAAAAAGVPPVRSGVDHPLASIRQWITCCSRPPRAMSSSLLLPPVIRGRALGAAGLLEKSLRFWIAAAARIN